METLRTPIEVPPVTPFWEFSAWKVRGASQSQEKSKSNFPKFSFIPCMVYHFFIKTINLQQITISGATCLVHFVSEDRGDAKLKI